MATIRAKMQQALIVDNGVDASSARRRPDHLVGVRVGFGQRSCTTAIEPRRGRGGKNAKNAKKRAVVATARKLAVLLHLSWSLPCRLSWAGDTRHRRPTTIKLSEYAKQP